MAPAARVPSFSRIAAGLVGPLRSIVPNFYTPAASAGVGLSSPSSLYGGGGPAPAPFNTAPAATGSPSAFYGIPQATGSPSAFYGTAPAAPAAKPTVKPAGRFPSANPTAPKPYVGLTDQQIRGQAGSIADAELAPLLARINGLADSQRKAGSADISAYTREFGPDLAQLAGINTAGLQTGVAGQAAIDDAVYKALSGAGGSAADELAGKLAQINAPTDAVDATRAMGTGAANAALATGSASLSALNTRLADARTVAGGQKGLAADFGLQALAGLNGQINTNQANQALQVESQRPGLIQSALTDLRGRQPKAFSLTPGQTELIPNGKGGYTSITAPAKPTAAAAPKTITTSLGTLGYDANSGKWYVIAPPKAAAAPKPPAGFTLSPGASRFVPDGKGGYTKITAPAAPTDAKAPAHFTAGNGQVWTYNRTTGKWEPVAGTQKPAGAQHLDVNASIKAGRWTNSDGTPNTNMSGVPVPKATAPKPTFGQVKAAVATGRDPTTGAITPALRSTLAAYTGVDPGPKLVGARWVAAQKAFGLTPSRTPAARLPAVSPTLSKQAGVWTTTGGQTWDSDPKTPGVQPRKWKSADNTSSAAKAKAAAERQAGAVAVRIATAAAKRVANSVVRNVSDPVTGQVTPKRVAAPGQHFTQSYYRTVHQVEAGVTPILSPQGYSTTDIIKFAQSITNAYYQPGEAGRPRTAEQVEAAAPTPPRFPKPKGLVPPTAATPPNPRATWSRAFQLPG